MKRPLTAMAALVLLFSVIAFAAQAGTPVNAQTGAESTIAALQTRVAELEATINARGQKINAQRTQIADLKSG